LRVDVLDLGRFYASPLGHVAQDMIGRRLSAIWPSTPGMDVLGFGYTTPWLERFRRDSRRVISAMPATQGVERWPSEAPALSALVDETRMPFTEALFDRVLVVHALEETEAARPLLRELWRILAPEGRLCVVVAARAGMWSQRDALPFGAGRPWSRGQLTRLLVDCMFEPTARARALYCPPYRFFAPGADGFEAVGEKLWPQFGGVVMVEAVKRLYAQTPRSGRVLLTRAPLRGAASSRSQRHHGEESTGIDQIALATDDFPVTNGRAAPAKES
jgi:SAM-dependent methyltransferase